MSKRKGNTIAFGVTLQKKCVEELIDIEPQLSRNAAINAAVRFYIQHKAKTPAA